MRIVLALVATALCLGGCLGIQARNNALAPAVQLAWDGVKEDVERGPNPAPATLPAFDLAVRGKDRAVLAGLVVSVWPDIKATAEANIHAAPFSAGVKASRLERVFQFDRALHQ